MSLLSNEALHHGLNISFVLEPISISFYTILIYHPGPFPQSPSSSSLPHNLQVENMDVWLF